ncbi:MAG: EI24 domain-containing protein [Burkholderiales bacterium]
MTGIGPALLFALANLAHARILWLMIWPVLVALTLWGAAALVFWGQLVLWLAGTLRRWVETATFFFHWDATDVAVFAAKALILVLLVPVIQLTALLILGIFGMPAMVDHVAGRRFADLARRHGGSFGGSVWNSVVAIFGMLLLGVVSIPFWLFPPLWPLIPVAILAWVNQRILRYDALAEHADEAEMRRIFSDGRGALLLLGFLLALISYVPVLGFFAPVVVGLTFIHYLLARLKVLREQPIC